jgi:D-3-phosphoglycerate dehydrogenase
MKHKILITGALHPHALQLLQSAPDAEVAYHPDISYGKLLELIPPFHALVTRSETKVPRELIDRAPHLKVIARASVGIGSIDIDYATERGILVINTPGKNTNSAAELTWALLLNAVRNVIAAHGTMQAQGWDRHRFTGTELLHKTIGIVGLGNVGHRVARFARAFDMEVLAYDPYIADDVFEANHVKKVDLATLVRQSDIVTVHVPKNKETTGMIGAEQIALMKEGVIVMNLARGGIVDEKALLAALKDGKVRGAGIDTWSEEPPPDNPFREFPHVVMTPHIGASTEEAQFRIGESVAEQTLRALRDEVVDFPVNMPRLKVLTNPRVKAYVVLAEKLGAFAMQHLDFNPRTVRVLFQGELTREDGAMIRRAFLKGYLKNTSNDVVTFVNAEQRAADRHIQVSDADDPGFSEYPSAIKFAVSDGKDTFSIAGVAFGENNIRICQVDEFKFEVIPAGHMLAMVNRDQPGVIGRVGTLLGTAGVNISQFELSRNMPGGKAMSLIRVDSPVPKPVLDQLRAISNMVSVRLIEV